MSSSSSAALIPRISGVDASIEVTNVTEVPLVDVSRQILSMLDRFRYYVILRNFAAAKPSPKNMPVARSTFWNIMVNDLNEEAVAHKFLHFVNADGSVGQRISIYGNDLNQAVDVAANSFIPLIKAIRKAAGTGLKTEMEGEVVSTGIPSDTLFRGTVVGVSTKIYLSVRAPEAFADSIAKVFGFNNDKIALDDKYYSYEHDLPYMR